ncbi:MAG TPA: hypothetical protein VFB29_14705 [Pseudolabrys sp.]|nr:hypothetical protein [Pseudolabrys sp.]
MPHDKHSSSDDAQSLEGRILRNFALLTLPWLSFQREILSIVKKGIEDASHVRPFEQLTSGEFQALMMILDPTRKWRDLCDSDLEKALAETYGKIIPKIVSGSFAFIEAQQAVLASASDLLNEARKNNQSKGGTGKKSSDRSGG